MKTALLIMISIALLPYVFKGFIFIIVFIVSLLEKIFEK